MLICSLTTLQVSAVSISFSDIKPGDWYEPYVTPLANAGVVNGYPDGTFKPDRTVTAGEALKMILLAAGFDVPAETGFHWASGFLAQAVSKNLIEKNEITDLDDDIIRGLVAKLVANALGLRQSEKSSAFTDTTSAYVTALQELGILNGYPDGTFRPANSLTRAELSAIVLRMMKYRDAQSAQTPRSVPSSPVTPPVKPPVDPPVDPPIDPPADQPLTREDLQEAFLATMWAYYWKQEQVQYDSYLYTSVDYMDGGVFRNTSEVAPEYGTADTTIYSVCSSYPYMAYCNTFEKDGKPFRWMTSSKDYATDYITYTMWQEGTAETTVVRWAQKLDETDDLPYCEKYGWDQQESFTAYRDMDAAEFAAWFAENWESVLQPGDILVTFRPGGHAVTYIGNGMLLESVGTKWSNGHEAYEDDGAINLYTVEDFFVNGSCSLGKNKIDRTDGTNEDGSVKYATNYFLIMRPLNLLVDEQDQALAGVTIQPAVRSRQKYVGLEIDRTVDITPFGTALAGDTLEYSVKLTNNSNNPIQGVSAAGDTGNTPVSYPQWHKAHFGVNSYNGMQYEALPVTETIPAGTELVEGSITGGGIVRNGKICWSVNLDAGSSVTLRYQVRVTDEIGSEITNDGGTVASIPSNTITNLVGGAKLDAAERVSGFEADISRYASQYSFLKENGTEFAEAFYEKVLGLTLELPTTQELFDALFEPATEQNSHTDAVAAGLFVPRADPAAGFEEFSGMLVRNYLGGEMIQTPHLELRRINEFRTEYLETGDILVKGDLTGSTVINPQTLVYLGNGQFAYYAGSRVVASGSSLRIWDSFSYDFFFMLRPSQIYMNLNTQLPAAEVFVPIRGDDGGDAQETPAQRQAALIEVANAYLAKGELLQYDSVELIGANKNTTVRSASFRETENVSPEDITSNSSYYGVIGAMIWEIYHEALGLEVGDCPGALVSAGRNVFSDWFVYNSANATDTLHTEDLDRFITEVLQPGDILFYTVGSSNKLHLYLGDGKILVSSGTKYTVKTGVEVHEASGGFKINDFKTTVGSNLRSIAVVRPIADAEIAEQKLITPATASRLAYPGLVIDRTADVSLYGTAYTGQTLTYTIVITNNGSSNYAGLPVREAIPTNTSYLSSIGGTYADGAVTWTLNIPAGQTVTLQYSVTVTGTYGQTVIADGGSVANIPSNCIVTAIGQEALDKSALGRLTMFTAESGVELGLSALNAQDIIRRVYGWAITGQTNAMFTQAAWNAEPMYAMLTSVRNTITSGGTVYDYPTRSQAEAAATGTAALYDQIVRGFLGGYRLYTRQLDNARIQDFHLNQLQPGDVLVKLIGGDTARAHYYLYLGGGRFLHTDSAAEMGAFDILTWENSTGSGVYANCVWDSLAKMYDFFFLQRPGQSVALSKAVH